MNPVFAIRRTVEPTQEPVSLDEVKLAIRVELTNTADDLRIQALITAARELCESYTRRAFCLQTWELVLDSLPPYSCPCEVWPNSSNLIIELPRPPLRAVTSVQYVDDTTQTMDAADYRVAAKSEPARLQPVSSWPGISDQVEAVTITYTAGYPPDESGSPTDYAGNVPESIKNAIKFAANVWYWQCEGCAQSELPSICQMLLNPYRVFSV